MSARNVVAEALDLLGMDEIRHDPGAAGDDILEALTTAGYLIVSPPVPSAVNYPGMDKATVQWADGLVLVNGKGCGKVRVYLDDHRLTPTEAREVGAGLFAGAAHAEAGDES